jgi:hypothetical protein
VRVAELLVFQGELVDGADEGGDVGAELGEFLVLVGDGLPEPGDGGAEPGLVLVMHAGFLDPVVELVLQVGVKPPGMSGDSVFCVIRLGRGLL